MIAIRVVNQKVIQVAFSGQSSQQIVSSILATNNYQSSRLPLNFARAFSQSQCQYQKVTNANNQQHLISIARNISFRKCPRNDDGQIITSSNANYSMAASASNGQFISATADMQSIYLPHELEEQVERSQPSPFEVIKKKAQGVVERREMSAAAAKAKKANQYYGQIFNKTNAITTTQDTKKLVVLMTWLEAKEKHIEKYRQFYLERGFDVLNVKTSPLDLLMPGKGAKMISKDFIRFMVDKQYSDVVLHGFSVGGFMFGQVLLDIDRQVPEVRDEFIKSIKGIVFDSLAPLEGTCVGVANSISRNRTVAKILENILKVYLKVGHGVATKYYLAANDKVWGGPLRCPTLFLYSKDDIVSDYRIVERLSDTWTKLGIECHNAPFDSAPHVQLYQEHRDAYTQKVEELLKKVNVL